jgi:hypothetical protein
VGFELRVSEAPARERDIWNIVVINRPKAGNNSLKNINNGQKRTIVGMAGSTEESESDNVKLISDRSHGDENAEHHILSAPTESLEPAICETALPISIWKRISNCCSIPCQLFVAIFVVISILNFMVCLVLYVQDFDFFIDVRESWTPNNCVFLRKACTCTCCMIRPKTPCFCPFRFTKPDRCSLLCPIVDLGPPMDSNCSAGSGNIIDSIDSYWGPGKPTCFLKFHRSAIVEYELGGEKHTTVIQNVSDIALLHQSTNNLFQVASVVTSSLTDC